MEPIVRAIDVGYGITKYVLSAERGQVRCAHFLSIAPATIGRDLAAALGRGRKIVKISIGGLTYATILGEDQGSSNPGRGSVT